MKNDKITPRDRSYFFMCKVCGSGHYTPYEELGLMMCTQCGFVWEDILHPDFLIPYDEDYITKYKQFPLKRMSELRADYLTENVPTFKSVLDYGFGTGDFLHTMYNLGYKTYGAEVNPEAWQQAPRYIKPYLEGMNIDVTTFYDSLEHIPDIEEIMETLQTKYLVISVPNFKGLDNMKNWRHYRPGEHIYYFNLNTLGKFVDKYGYKFITAGYPEDEIRNTYPANILTAVYEKV